MSVAVSVWVCIASIVTVTPVSSSPANSVRAAGISLLFASTATCPSTAPAAWSNAAIRCGAFPSGRVRAPRTVLPSRAITRRPPAMRVRVHIHRPTAPSKASASIRANSLRNVDSSGALVRVHPNSASCSAVACAAH